MCGYAPKAKDSGTAKQLSVFIQTVAQQAATDNQQVYLVNQLTTALCNDEAPVADRVALRTVLLQGIFPAYIEATFSSRIAWLIASPVMQCLPSVLDEIAFDLRVNQPDNLLSTVQTIISVIHAFIRGTEHLKGDRFLFEQSNVLSGLGHMFEVATSVVRLLDYIVGRSITSTGHSRPPLTIYLEEFSGYVAQMIKGTALHDIPSYREDAHATSSNGHCADLLAFCKKGLESGIEANWSDDQCSVWFGQGRAKKEVVFDIGSRDEKSRLTDTLQRFQDTLRKLTGDERPQLVGDFGDGIVV
jgi:hypothetical protein